MSRVARHAVVHGRVQGVAFRHHTKIKAREIGLGGWVRNLASGEVEAWIEGEEADVETLLAWMKRGPPAATVTRLEVEAVAPAGHVRFTVHLD